MFYWQKALGSAVLSYLEVQEGLNIKEEPLSFAHQCAGRANGALLLTPNRAVASQTSGAMFVFLSFIRMSR